MFSYRRDEPTHAVVLPLFLVLREPRSILKREKQPLYVFELPLGAHWLRKLHCSSYAHWKARSKLPIRVN